ncbi:hypothetical protein ACFLQ7_00315 [Actinomycetota bacterium]
MRCGFVAIGRPTFDVPFAQESADAALANLRSAGWDVVGSADVAMDIGAVNDRLADAIASEV